MCFVVLFQLSQLNEPDITNSKLCFTYSNTQFKIITLNLYIMYRLGTCY